MRPAPTLGLLTPLVLVTLTTIDGVPPAPVIFGAVFLVWAGLMAGRKKAAEDNRIPFELLGEWGYWMIIPSSLVAALWTVLDIARSIKPIPAFDLLPAADLSLWSAFWALLPPVFFFIEFHVMWNTCQGDNDTFDRLKHQQQLAGAVWLAIVTIIGGASVRQWLERDESNKVQQLEQRIEVLESRLPTPLRF